MRLSRFPILKKLWPALLLFILLVAAGAWLAFRPAAAQASKDAQTTYQTSTIQRGDLAVEAIGSGTLVSSLTADLAFLSSGTVTGLSVQAGDPVEAGQVLASLEEIDELKAALQARQYELDVARKALDDLQSGGPQALADALAARSAAQSAYEEAQKNHRLPGVGRCEKTVTQEYWKTYFYSVLDARVWEDFLESDADGYGDAYLTQKLKPIYEARDKAYANWKYCEGYSEQEIEESDAALQLAEANLSQAERVYSDLLAVQGVDPLAVEMAEATERSAELQVIEAEIELGTAEIKAPFSGTVIAVNAQDGDLVKSAQTLITVADLSKPYLQARFDEADLGSVAAGCAATVTFDSYPDRTFQGTVTSVAPVLLTSDQITMIEAEVALPDASLTPEKHLPLNLNGTVELSCSSAQDVLLAPLSALYQAADGSRYVYVLDATGAPQKRTVEVGLVTDTMVEVQSGLQPGEQVIVSKVALEAGQ